MFGRFIAWRRPGAAPEQTANDEPIVMMEKSHTVKEQQTDFDVVDTHDPGASTLAEYRRIESEIRQLEAEERSEQSDLAARVAQPFDGQDLDALTDELSEAQGHITRRRIRIELLHRRRERLGDDLHGLIVRDRLRAQGHRRGEIAELHQQRAAIDEEVEAHEEAIEELRAKAADIDARSHSLERQIRELEISTNRRVDGIEVASASVQHPPRGALVKPSVWRAFLEAARAADRSGQESIVVNESTGEIIQSSVSVGRA